MKKNREFIKRLVSLFMALMMTFTCLPLEVFAEEIGEGTNSWSGRSAVFVGDSITAGAGVTEKYYQHLAEALDLGAVTAMGVGGSCISAASDYGQNNQPLINRYQDIPSVDLIMIFMGTNDYGHETPLGTAEDTQDGTFYGALNVIVPTLVAKHTSSKIVFVTPIHRYGFGTSKILGTKFTYDNLPNGVGATLEDYVKAIKTVCANNDVDVIDLYAECTLDPADATVRSTYMPDGLHPNDAGHAYIAEMMEAHIRGFEPVVKEPLGLPEMIQGNKFASGNNQPCRASSRINYYLEAGTVITLKDPSAMQWACAKTSNENSSNNLGYFPDSQWTDKETAVVAEDGWIGFTFKYRDETRSFDLTKPLSDFITIEAPHTHNYTTTITAPTCTEQGFTTHACECGDSYVDSYVEAKGHDYESGICTGCGAVVSPYLQQLPKNILGCTNLYETLAPVKGYYTATKYDTSNGAVLSVVIPVEPGDRIAASSFGPVSENMGSVNGIRVTYLLGDKIVTSLSPGEVYSGYTDNGYITVPEGVNAVCIPWWTPSDSNWLTLSQNSKNFAMHSPKSVSAQAPTCTEKGYTAGEICEVCNSSLGERKEISPTGHSYSGDTCTVCGTVNLLAFLDGKYVSVLGDSISTFNGYSNDATVNNTIGGNGPRYDAGAADTKPGSYCLLESVDQTWWMHFANRSGMKLLVNNSWAGSQVFGGKTSDGRVIPAAYLDRCVNLHDNTLENNSENAPINPDMIFVYLGINDYNFNRNNVGTGAVNYSSLVSSDGTYVTPATFGEAYGIMLHKMRKAYPNAQIFAMTLLPENLYSVDKTAWEQHNAYIRAAAECYDIPVVDLAENCAITWENYSGYMIDKIHPTTAGMKLISDCIETELLSYFKENPPHTHNYTTTFTAPTCTEQGFTTHACECGDSYMDSYAEAKGHSYKGGKCTACGETAPSLKGKTISILGASISTFAGTSNGVAADTTNSTIRNNAKYYPHNVVTDVELTDTWWMQVANDLGLRLLVNNSWSGSSLLHERNGTVGAYVDRCVQLHDDTGDNAGEMPDIIGIQMGTNDFQYYKDTLGTANINYAALISENEDGNYTYATPVTSLEAAAIVLHKISVRYPDAEVYYLNISQRVDDTDELIQSFNGELKKVVEHFGAHIVDIYGSAITMADFDTYIGDGKVHPNKLGMDAYAEAFKKTLVNNTAYTVDTHTVSLNLDDVTADYGDDKIVVDGSSYTVKLSTTAKMDLDVTVTMGGKDVTASAYANGTVTLDSVTDDVTITAKAVYEPKEYRWTFNGTDLACVRGSNALTKLSGSTTDGVFSKTSYALADEVVLLHNLPWVVEWKCEGTFLNTGGSSGARVFTSDNVNANYDARYIFKSNTNGLVAMGEKTTSGSHNYGIALADYDIDWTKLHTYRLENRIANDGGNMVWLSVDGVEIGALDNYYVGTTNKNTTSNWLSGKDFVFPYMGTDTHGFTNASIDHITVWEGGHAHNYKATVTAPTCTEQGFTTHACECSDSYVDSYVDAKGHSYKGGKCTVCGETIPQPEWEQGTILAATGLEKDTEKVIRTSDYLRISDYVGMTLNAGHYITYFVYDAQYNYLGNGSSDLTANFLLNGQGISTHEMQIRYPEGVYFRIALWRGNNNTMTLEMLDEAGVECLDATHEPVFWEMGSIYAASGLAFVRGQVIRSVNYLPIESYAGVTVADGYAISFLAYDENLTYLGNGNPEKKGYFIPARVTMQEITDQYPTAKYVRLLLVEQPLADFSMDAVELSDIRIYKVGEIVPEKTYSYQGFEASFEIEFVYGLLDVNNGTYHSTDSGFVTARAIPLKHVSKITWAEDHSLLWSAYNAQNEYLGSATTYSDSGEVTKADILAVYDEANYVAVSVKPTVQRDLELTEMVKESGLTIHHDLSHTGSIAHNTVMQAQKSQDGAIYDNTLFLFDKYGQCTVYDTSDKLKLGSFTLDKIDLLNPHANSVCFSDVFYEEGDSFPLLYVNIYNNYWTTDDPKEGTCCVYRIFEENGTYSTKLIQVLKIGFTDDYDLWNSAEGNGYHYYLPYGNFVVDTDENKLWAFVLRNGDNQTRFFRFDLPEIGDGIYNESYGCNVVTLEASDIEDLFDLEHFEILQGCTYANGKIYSANGLGTSSSYNAFAELKVVNLRSKSVAAIVDFSILGFSLEPEMISFNVGGDGQLYYLSIDGVLRKLRFADSPLNAPLVESSNHTYTSGICTVCGAEDPDYVPTFLYLNEAVAYLREQMKARIGTVTLRIADMELTAEQGNTMLSDAIAHTGVPTEGDYFRRNMGFKSCSVTTGEDANGVYSDVTFKFDWYTTAEMEAEVDAAMETLLNELNLWNASDYEKIVGVYDWIGENIEYDHDRYDEEGSTIEHTTYAAIVDRLAVCQGYASLYYRLLLELGVDCRVISGLAGLNGGESHAWNIVKLEGKYYNADPTWDADLKGHYRYFLCTMENFKEHVRDDEFDSESFHTQYPMSLVPYVVNATASGSVNGAIEWVLDGETGTLTVAGTGAIPSYRYASAPWYPYRESVKSIVVSEGITEVGERAFYWCTNCTSVTLPESLVAIREYGFNNLRALQEIKLPSKLTTIEFCAFSECVGLQSIVIPNSVTTIGSSAFSNCYALTSATLSAGMTTVPDSMFFGDRNLKKVVLQNGLTTIGDTAFADCGITSFTIPATVTSIGVSAFAGCRSNNSFTVKAGNTAYKAVNGVLFTYDGKTLISYPAGKFGNSYAVPEGTVTIDHSAFSDAYMLKTITFASSVRTIMHSAFAHCDVLASITFPSGITSIGDSALRECNKLTSVTFENPDVVLGPSVFSDCDGLVSIQLPTRLKELSYGMFSGCAKLKNVTIPSTVTKMGSTVFADCDSLVSITVPGSVKSLGQQAFDFCNNLETIIFEEGVESLGWICIRNAPSLKKVVLPSSITTIEKENFEECPNVVVYVNCGSVAHRYAQSNSVATSVAHSYETTITVPTCTTQGYTTHTCAVCGSSYKDAYVSALGHSYGDWEIVKESTCIELGSERRDCVRCDAYETQVIEVTEHPYEAVVTAPTCTDRGYTTHTCTVCGDSYVDNYVNAMGHTEAKDVSILPTFKSPGLTEGKHCSVCKTVLLEQTVIPAKGIDAILEDKEFKLLLIGNSYSQDASNCGQSMMDSQLLNILQSMLGDDVKVTVGLIQSGGKGVNWHATQAELNKKAYGFTTITSEFPTWKSMGSVSSAQALAWTNWDMVSLQPHSVNTTTGNENVTYPDSTAEKFYSLEVAAEYMLDHISRYAPQADVYCYMHWAQTSQIALNAALSSYNKMAKFYPETLDYVGTESGKVFADIIPVGLSVQNARTTYLALLAYNTSAYADGNLNLVTDAQIGLQRDGSHLSFNIGRYIAALTFAETLVPEELRVDDYVLPNIRKTESIGVLPVEYSTIAQMAVTKAVDSWQQESLSITTIEGYSNEPVSQALKALENKAISVICTAGEMNLQKQISDQVLSALPADFAVAKIVLPADLDTSKNTRFTVTVTARFGYTSKDVVITVSLGSEHNFSQWFTSALPTCTEEGIERRDCKNCDHFETRDVVAKGHTEVIDEAVAPTCTETGFTEGKHCSVCNTVLVKQEVVNAKGHSYGAWGVTTAPTCTEKGEERRDCKNCDHFEPRDIAAKGHTEVTDKAVAPTCTETGLTEGKHCSVCDAVLVKQEVVAANGHDYETVVTAPTCTERGYTTHTCIVCDDSYVDSYVSAKGHSYGAWTVTTAPTCTEQGVERRDCKNCDHFETRDVAAKGHSYKSVVTAPTCTERGYTTHTCTACGDSYVDSYVNTKGHSYGAWAVITASTCTEKGVEHRDCQDCDHFETREVAAKGHTEVIDEAVAPTCTETGLTEGKHCSVCDAVLVKQEAVAANGHDYEIVVTAPTCTERGYTTHTCSVCDDSYVDSYVNAKGHSYGAWTVTTAPTCTEKGTERRDCKNCDHFETREIAAKGHTEVIDKAVAPTCTETGLTEGKHCSVCTVIIVAPELLPALGHEYDKWYISLDATCTAEGEEKRECERCDVFETKVIAALGHTEVIDAAVAPTCIASGLTEGKHCTVCEAVITPQEIVQPLGHTFGAFAPVAIDPELGHYQQCLVCDYVSAVIPHADMDGNTWCDDCNYSMILRIQYFALSHEYILLTAGESAELLPIIEPAGMVNRIVWSSSDESVFTIDENGVISAKAEGTAYAEAYVTSFGEEYTLRCRVDVSAEPIEEIELKAHIGVTNVTSNIYSTNYAETEIILDLPHYISEISTFGLRGNGISIESAYFVDETVAAMFDLHVTDDRVLQLIPKVDTSDAAALKLIKSSYKSAIAVVLVGEEEPLVTPEVLNIRVDKKLPTVKATAVKFNTFFTTDTKPLVLSSTGGKVSSIEVVEQPDWLTVDCAMMQVSVSAQNGKYSGKLKLLATVEGYTTAVPVTVSVSAAVVKPKVKLSAASATIFNQAELSEGIFLTVLSNDKKIPYAELGITNISLAELNEKEVKTYAGNSVYEITDFDITTGQFLVSVRKGVAPISGKVLLKVTFNDVDSQFITLPLSIKLYTKAPMLKLSKTSATLNKDLGIGMDSFETKLTVTPADYNYGALDIHVFDKTGKIELTDVLAVQVNGDKIVIRTTTNTEYNATYKVTVGLADAPSVKPVTITIKTLPVNKGLVTLTLTGKGSIDTVRPYATSITLTPKYKNYNNFGVMDERFTVLATNTKAKPQVSVDVTDKFDVIRNANGTYTLKVKDGEHLDPTLKYTVSMSSENMYAKAESKAISLSIKQGSVKVSQSTKSVNLYKSDRFSRRYVTISIADETVLSIDRIELQNADKSLFEVIDFGDGLCAIGFKDSRVAPKIKNGSIKLNVFLEGNETTKPNATVSVSVKVVAFR